MTAVWELLSTTSVTGGGHGFSLGNRGDQTPHPQNQAGGSREILQQQEGPAISGVPGVDLGATFNRPLFGAVALAASPPTCSDTTESGPQLGRSSPTRVTVSTHPNPNDPATIRDTAIALLD